MFNSILSSISLPTEFEVLDGDILDALKAPSSTTEELLVQSIETTIARHIRMISRHHEALAFYRGRLNMLQRRSINTILPPEILARSFYFFACSYHLQDNLVPILLLTPGLVCRHWRNVLLTTPDVFSGVYIPAGRVEWLQTSLRCSGQVPLNILCQDIPEDEQWSAYLPHISRTQSLDISTDISTLPQWPWPRSTVLTSLSFCHRDYSGNATRMTPFPTIDNILNALPKLLNLHCDSQVLGVDWTERNLPVTLRTLSISHTRGYNISPSVPKLVTAIRKLVSLRRLTLTGLAAHHYPLSPQLSSHNRTMQPLQICLEGSLNPCVHILGSVEAVEKLDLDLHLSLYEVKAGVHLGVLLEDVLPGILGTQEQLHQESYGLFLRIITNGNCNRFNYPASRFELHAMPSVTRTPLSHKELQDSVCRSTSLRLDRFRHNISLAITGNHADGDSEPLTDGRAFLTHQFYSGLLPLFFRIDTLTVAIASEMCDPILKPAWDAIVSYSGNVHTLQVGLSHDEPCTRKDCTASIDIPFTLGEFEHRDIKEGANFPSLRHFDLWFGSEVWKLESRFVEDIARALEERKRRGLGLRKLVWDVPSRYMINLERFDDLVVKDFDDDSLNIIQVSDLRYHLAIGSP